MPNKSSPIVYLDNNSTTELSQDVSGILMDIIVSNIYGNPNSPHDYGTKMRTVVEAARYGVSEALSCSPNEVIFTGGGTESNNLAIRGVYNNFLDVPEELVISAGEHSSVYNTALAVASEDNIRIIPLTAEGGLDMEWADRLITEDTSLVSVMLANNETGALFPVKEIVELAHSRGVLVHCDAVQAFGKVNIDVKDLGVDLLSISGHKAHALPGVGALYIRRGVMVHPLLSGGGQEGGLRPGTENYVGIATLGAVSNEITENPHGFSSGLRDAFEKGITRRIDNIVINANSVARTPNTSSVTFKGIHALSMVTALAEQGIYVSAGAACSTGSTKPSRTLTSMGVCEEDALSTVRFSFSKMSSMEDTALAIEACVRCVTALRQGHVE